MGLLKHNNKMNHFLSLKLVVRHLNQYEGSLNGSASNIGNKNLNLL